MSSRNWTASQPKPPDGVRKPTAIRLVSNAVARGVGMSQACQAVIRRANQFDRFDGVHVAHAASNSAKTRARENEFHELIQADLGCQSAKHKYFSFRKSEIVYCCRRPASARGAYASSRTWGGMRWTRWCRKTSDASADGEVVWSWRPDAGAKFSWEAILAKVTGAKEPGPRGEREISC